MGSELLQISPDEQRRAARTAALFTEEELTRFLQVMLRTFDELGYRQEQRFHFELGLLKLVHLKRLLPVEEVLSSIEWGGVRKAGSRGRCAVPWRAPAASAVCSLLNLKPGGREPAKPAFSPFEQTTQKRTVRRDCWGAACVVASAAPNGLGSTEGFGASAYGCAGSGCRSRLRLRVRRLLWLEPVKGGGACCRFLRLLRCLSRWLAVPRLEEIGGGAGGGGCASLPCALRVTADSDTAVMQRAVVEALAGAKQGSAADAMGDATWTLAGGEVEGGCRRS